MTDRRSTDAEAWKRARTLEDLGELTARWLEGTLKYNPVYASEPDKETDPLRETLATFNRKGFVTTFSQPAVPIDDEGYGQRASVEGYAREDVARRLGALGLWTDLLVFHFPPGEAGGYQVPITVDDFHPFAWLGSSYGYAELEPFAEDCSREALGELMRAWVVAIIDPRWGRESYLWDHVSRVLEGRAAEKRFAVEPAPHLGLDTDFVF